MTGAAAVDGIDHAIWREESRCGFQSRRQEREIIPTAAACSRRTYFYSPLRLSGRAGAEPEGRSFLPKELSLTLIPVFLRRSIPGSPAFSGLVESKPKFDIVGKMQTHVCSPSPLYLHLRHAVQLGGTRGWSELAILWREPINLECAALGPGRVRLKWAAAGCSGAA